MYVHRGMQCSGLGATFTTASFFAFAGFSTLWLSGGALHSRFTYSSRKFRRYRGSVHVCHFFSDGNMGFCTVQVVTAFGFTIPIAVATVRFMSALGTCIALLSFIPTGVSAAKKSTDAICTLLPTIMVASCFVIVSRYESFTQEPALVMVAFGVSLTQLTNRMIVSSVCRMDFPLFQVVALPAPALAYAISAGKLNYPNRAIAAYAAISSVCFFHYGYNVIRQLCDRLGIYCFSLKKKVY